MRIESRANILGVGINVITLSEAIEQIAIWIDEKSAQYVNVCNVHTVIECQRNPRLREIVNSSGLATPDGMPLVWICRYYGHKKSTRVCGSDLLLSFCEYSVSRQFRHFFYGGAPGVAQSLATELARRYPGLKVVGAHSPPFRPVGALEEAAVIDSINAAKPDILWVGLGTPKQDFWLALHRPLLDVPVLVAVGAAFDFYAATIRRAPLFLQRCGLEWLFRLAQEPRRLWYRYFVYNSLFIYLVLAQTLGLRRYSLE